MSELQLINFTFESNSKPWKALVAFLTNFNNEVDFQISNNGIKIKIFDPSHASVLLCEWNKSQFQKYETNLEDDKTQPITLNVDTLALLFKRFKDDEIINVSFNPGRATLIIKNGDKEFELKTIVGGNEKTNPPNVPYENKSTISITKFKDMIADAKVLQASGLWFIGDGSKLSYESSDKYASGSAKGTIFNEFTTVISNTAFQLEYLEPIMNSAEKYCKEITMQLKHQAPIHLIFTIEGLGDIKYWLGNFSQSD